MSGMNPTVTSKVHFLRKGSRLLGLRSKAVRAGKVARSDDTPAPKEVARALLPDRAVFFFDSIQPVRLLGIFPAKGHRGEGADTWRLYTLCEIVSSSQAHTPALPLPLKTTSRIGARFFILCLFIDIFLECAIILIGSLIKFFSLAGKVLRCRCGIAMD